MSLNNATDSDVWAGDILRGDMTHGSLFSGIGGFELGAKWAGIETLWNCEIEPFNRAILKQHFPESKQYEDIRELSNPESVDIISGGFPCQDISIAGSGEGISGSRSGLWGEMFRIIREVRPRYVLIENSPMLTVRGLEYVLCDLSKIGYNAEWQCLSGKTFGVQQNRERIYIIAYTIGFGQKRDIKKTIFSEQALQGEFQGIHPGWRTRRDLPEPRTFRKINDLPNLVDRNKAIGNAVMPKVAKYLFECIKQFDQGRT